MTTCFPEQPRSAVIQIPATQPNGVKRRIDCVVESMQGKRLLLGANEAIAPYTIVSVEYEDTMFLGEVVQCTGLAAAWSVEIVVKQVLNGLQSLMALRSRLLSEGVPQPVGEARHASLLN